MPDPAPLLTAVDRLADRFRSMPQSRLTAPVPGHPSRAAAALALARRLAADALAVEGAAAPGGAPGGMPDAGPFAAGDQLAVAGHDLAAALAPLAPDAPVATRDGVRSAADAVLADAVAAVGAVAELVGG
ncbi:hypothetical protein LO771_16135 [Streptacidiphilus sp. ASG 303]|uniref:hypothetical protein n=1 Tax=Streptacidiphilus sp. ASG 303 TaxID=2896847 RepID=UPI001E3E349C|nr:hypothetical protein [Streptacidiphilus sp. ASG 303]MCD0483884.1 hypothetical protein [Streptacidiphilus sp. ASG 303]